MRNLNQIILKDGHIETLNYANMVEGIDGGGGWNVKRELPWIKLHRMLASISAQLPSFSYSEINEADWVFRGTLFHRLLFCSSSSGELILIGNEPTEDDNMVNAIDNFPSSANYAMGFAEDELTGLQFRIDPVVLAFPRRMLDEAWIVPTAYPVEYQRWRIPKGKLRELSSDVRLFFPGVDERATG